MDSLSTTDTFQFDATGMMVSLPPTDIIPSMFTSSSGFENLFGNNDPSTNLMTTSHHQSPSYSLDSDSALGSSAGSLIFSPEMLDMFPLRDNIAPDLLFMDNVQTEHSGFGLSSHLPPSNHTSAGPPTPLDFGSRPGRAPVERWDLNESKQASPGTSAYSFPASSAAANIGSTSMPFNNAASSASNMLSSNFFAPKSDSICPCLANGLSLLNQLTPPNQDAIACPVSPESAIAFDAVMERNEAALDSISEILKCPSAHDDSLLLILSMILFKVLGWYAAAASAIPRRHDVDVDMKDQSDPRLQVVRPPKQINAGSGIEDETADSIVCQLVLSKIYSVQRNVNMLSQRLQAAESRDRRQSTGSNASRTAGAAQDLLFDGCMLNQSTSHGIARSLEASLRSRLRELSQGMVDTLLEHKIG